MMFILKSRPRDVEPAVDQLLFHFILANLAVGYGAGFLAWDYRPNARYPEYARLGSVRIQGNAIDQHSDSRFFLSSGTAI